MHASMQIRGGYKRQSTLHVDGTLAKRRSCHVDLLQDCKSTLQGAPPQKYNLYESATAAN